MKLMLLSTNGVSLVEAIAVLFKLINIYIAHAGAFKCKLTASLLIYVHKFRSIVQQLSTTLKKLSRFRDF